MGPAPVTAWFGIGAVALQTGVAVAIADAPWWALLLAAYSVGAVASLALLVLVHETIHNLVFRRPAANIWLGIFINLPNLFPSATSFRKYHLAHHRHHGDPILDGDIPGEREAEWVGRSPARKALWLFFMWAVQISRTRRMKSVAFADRWLFANVVAAGVFVLALALVAGPGAIAYLFLSSIFGIGLHPLGARWIQEHHRSPTASPPTPITGRSTDCCSTPAIITSIMTWPASHGCTCRACAGSRRNIMKAFMPTAPGRPCCCASCSTAR
jgi:sphingolipid delta-4 desaturase